MKKSYTKLMALFAAAAAVFSPALAHAGNRTITLPTASQFGFNNISDAIAGVMNLVFFFALLLVLVYLVWGGIQWITAGGDKAGLEAARGKITGAIVGIIIVAVAFAIYNILLTFVGAGNVVTITGR